MTLEKIIESDPGLIASVKLATVHNGDEIIAIFASEMAAQTWINRQMQRHTVQEWKKGYFSQQWLKIPFNPRIV